MRELEKYQKIKSSSGCFNPIDGLYKIPNPPHDSSPKGKDESDNVEVRSWGSKPEFDFTPKTHTRLESLELFDFISVKLSGMASLFILARVPILNVPN